MARLSRCQARKNLGVPSLGEKYVGRLDVAMNDSLAVGRTECVRNVNPQFKYFVKLKRFAGNVVLRQPSQYLYHL
jgi:hypothetical protein